jgi:hypothetical protein
MAEYMIRRNSVFTEFKNIRRINSPRKGYSETVISRQNAYPKSVQLERGDTVYVSESGIGIFAVGKVIDGVVNKPIVDFPTCYSLEEIVKNYNIKEPSSYWTDKLKTFHQRNEENSNYIFRYHQYFLNQRLLPTIIPFEGPLKKYVQQGYAWSFTKLKQDEVEFIENPIIPPNIELKLDIPSSLRFELHALFNRKIDVNHWIDIDHLVPKSVGGPGNIKENLVPIGFSLNRYKNDSIPVDFFQVAKLELNWNLTTDTEKLLLANESLIKIKHRSAVRDEATRINTEVWNRGIQFARNFYGKIMQINYPEYYRIIKLE